MNYYRNEGFDKILNEKGVSKKHRQCVARYFFVGPRLKNVLCIDSPSYFVKNPRIYSERDIAKDYEENFIDLRVLNTCTPSQK